jgi:hypothetical protein
LYSHFRDDFMLRLWDNKNESREKRDLLIPHSFHPFVLLSKFVVKDSRNWRCVSLYLNRLIQSSDTFYPFLHDALKLWDWKRERERCYIMNILEEARHSRKKTVNCVTPA